MYMYHHESREWSTTVNTYTCTKKTKTIGRIGTSPKLRLTQCVRVWWPVSVVVECVLSLCLVSIIILRKLNFPVIIKGRSIRLSHRLVLTCMLIPPSAALNYVRVTMQERA